MDTKPFDLDQFLAEALDEELPGFQIPDVADKEPGWLVDKCGEIKDRRKRLDKYEKLLVAVFKQRDLPTGTKGNTWQANLSTTSSTRLDQEVVKTLLTHLYDIGIIDDDTYQSCYSTTESQTLRVERL